jgi:beta-galactosidase
VVYRLSATAYIFSIWPCCLFLGFQEETVLKLVRLLLQVEVAVEGPREMIANSKLSQYTVEAVLFENFDDDDERDFKVPSEAAHLQPQGLDSAMIGCHAHTSLTAQLQRPKLWSAENVIYALIYLPAALSQITCLEYLNEPESLTSLLFASLQPNLYTVVVLLRDPSGAVIDCEACRVGVRQISTRPKELLVNGEPVVIRGVNRHEHHPRLGKTNVEACMIKV